MTRHAWYSIQEGYASPRAEAQVPAAHDEVQAGDIVGSVLTVGPEARDRQCGSAAHQWADRLAGMVVAGPDLWGGVGRVVPADRVIRDPVGDAIGPAAGRVNFLSNSA
jgi:hypothetical protein